MPSDSVRRGGGLDIAVAVMFRHLLVRFRTVSKRHKEG
jgi:hypothetical protein